MVGGVEQPQLPYAHPFFLSSSLAVLSQHTYYFISALTTALRVKN
jgi:hypothetical protein